MKRLVGVYETKRIPGVKITDKLKFLEWMDKVAGAVGRYCGMDGEAEFFTDFIEDRLVVQAIQDDQQTNFQYGLIGFEAAAREVEAAASSFQVKK
jgi:hypothetical protein